MTNQKLLAAAGSALLLITLSACGSDTDTSNATLSSTVSSEVESISTTLTSEAETAISDVEDRANDAEAALRDGDFSLMAEAFDLTGLSDEIEGRAVTILAPSNDAFDEIDGDVYKDLLTDVDAMRDVIRRHVLDGAYSIDDLRGMSEVKTIGGDTLAVVVDGDDVTIDGSIVTATDQDAISGKDGQEISLLHIDRVLLPAS